MEKQAVGHGGHAFNPSSEFKASLVYTEFKTELQRAYLKKVMLETMLESIQLTRPFFSSGSWMVLCVFMDVKAQLRSPRATLSRFIHRTDLFL